VLAAAGFLAVFAAVGAPLVLGLTEVAKAVPWAGIVLGTALTAVGILVVTGGAISVPIQPMEGSGLGRGRSAAIAFGAGYGLSSVGCTLPIFLALVGVSVSRPASDALLAFGGYSLGVCVALVTLALAGGALRYGFAHRLRRLSPYFQRVGGALLTVSGLYTTYYWARLEFGPHATLSSDPLVALVTQFAARFEDAASVAALPLVLSLAATGGMVILFIIRRNLRPADSAGERRAFRGQRFAPPSAMTERSHPEVDQDVS
jgi:cytochrome c biogenesis protein CcdA